MHPARTFNILKPSSLYPNALSLKPGKPDNQLYNDEGLKTRNVETNLLVHNMQEDLTAVMNKTCIKKHALDALRS